MREAFTTAATRSRVDHNAYAVLFLSRRESTSSRFLASTLVVRGLPASIVATVARTSVALFRASTATQIGVGFLYLASAVHGSTQPSFASTKHESAQHVRARLPLLRRRGAAITAQSSRLHCDLEPEEREGLHVSVTAASPWRHEQNWSFPSVSSSRWVGDLVMAWPISFLFKELPS
ncbi:hypothetical protein E2542_SST03857 [Spatholobus suberectus]|nr:hypothetical protein E2542_SST03857 [Spatholobus suberectus]